MWNVPVLQHHSGQHRYVAASSFQMGRIPPPPYYSSLLDLADILIREGRYELAVIVAQMACEVVVEQTLTPLLKGKRRVKGKRGRALGNFNLAGRALNVYVQYTNDKSIKDQELWKPFTRHAKPRAEVVHFGGRVHPAEARESTTTARQFVEHVHEVRGRVL